MLFGSPSAQLLVRLSIEAAKPLLLLVTCAINVAHLLLPALQCISGLFSLSREYRHMQGSSYVLVHSFTFGCVRAMSITSPRIMTCCSKHEGGKAGAWGSARTPEHVWTGTHGHIHVPVLLYLVKQVMSCWHC